MICPYCQKNVEFGDTAHNYNIQNPGNVMRITYCVSTGKPAAKVTA